jgi:hypothetical protein
MVVLCCVFLAHTRFSNVCKYNPVAKTVFSLSTLLLQCICIVTINNIMSLSDIYRKEESLRHM